MLENAPLESFSCSILYKYVIKLMIEKRNVLTKTLKVYSSTRCLSKAI